MKKTYFWRGLFYVAGLLVLAMGITLNTKTGFGVSALVSVSYCISELWNLNFGNMTFVLYSTFMVLEMIVHIVSFGRRGKAQVSGRQGGAGGAGEECGKAGGAEVPGGQDVAGKAGGADASSRHGAGGRSLKLILLTDLLQLPMSLVFTRFINLFGSVIPDLKTAYPDTFPGSFAGRFLILLLAIVCTGVGAAMSLNMRLVPCPADGVVQAIADAVGKGVGLVKNCFDFVNLSIALVLGLAVGGRVIGIGIGTVAAMLGVGRVIALFNRLCKKRMDAMAGMERW